jgi:plasmid stability protein
MQYREGMSKMIQIRNVPEDVHRELKVRASRAGMSLSDFLNAELVRVVARRPLGELVSELGNDPSLRSGEAAAAVRAGRRT